MKRLLLYINLTAGCLFLHIDDDNQFLDETLRIIVSIVKERNQHMCVFTHDTSCWFYGLRMVFSKNKKPEIPL